MSAVVSHLTGQRSILRANNSVAAQTQDSYDGQVDDDGIRRKTEERSMQTVNIAELKNNLSAYLELVRAGEEVLVKDRHRPIAKLVPLTIGEDIEVEELEMAAAGLVRLPTSSLPPSFWKMPAPRVSLKDAVAAVRAERDED
jgi:prevent-host-death family protein